MYEITKRNKNRDTLSNLYDAIRNYSISDIKKITRILLSERFYYIIVYKNIVRRRYLTLIDNNKHIFLPCYTSKEYIHSIFSSIKSKLIVSRSLYSMINNTDCKYDLILNFKTDKPLIIKLDFLKEYIIKPNILNRYCNSEGKQVKSFLISATHTNNNFAQMYDRIISSCKGLSNIAKVLFGKIYISSSDVYRYIFYCVSYYALESYRLIFKDIIHSIISDLSLDIEYTILHNHTVGIDVINSLESSLKPIYTA